VYERKSFGKQIMLQNETFMFLKSFVCKLHEINVIKEQFTNTLDLYDMYTIFIYFMSWNVAVGCMNSAPYYKVMVGFMNCAYSWDMTVGFMNCAPYWKVTVGYMNCNSKWNVTASFMICATKRNVAVGLMNSAPD